MTILRLTSLKALLSEWNNIRKIPLNIAVIDNTIGGLLYGYLHVVKGDSGAGKTLFCLRTIDKLLNYDPDALILYSEFSGHLRAASLKKFFLKSQKLDQITIFQPRNLLEQIFFFRNLLDNANDVYNLIVLDTIFGSPLDSLQYFKQEKKIWENRIFSHLIDLRRIASMWEIPIMITNHLIPNDDRMILYAYPIQYGQEIIEQFVPIDMLIWKTEQGHYLQLRFFTRLVGDTNFELIPKKCL
ncbi:MAG: hypothetical protein ACFE95_02315 [Candidatus Hodarchaeota archaeon]